MMLNPSLPKPGAPSLGMSSAHYARRKITNVIMLTLTGAATVLAIVPLIWITAYVTIQGSRFLNIEFFTQLPTPVGVPGGGVINAIVGTGIVVGVACLIAIPIAIVGAFYAADHPNTPLGLAIRFGTDVLSGIPSIVMGIFAYTIIVLPQKRFSAFSAGVALAIIMLPLILRTTEEMLKLVPRNLREGSLALGASNWRTSVQVLLPAALNGVVTGIMLAIARAAGEAAPMLFTAFGSTGLVTDLNESTATLPHTIYIYAMSPFKDWQEKAWAAALVLIALVLGLNILARALTWWRARQMGLNY
jgi:phosphate transport system permease protein